MPDAAARLPRKPAGRLALVGLVLILLGVGAASSPDILFPGQDPAGKGMAAGLLFFAGVGSGLVVLIIAAVRRLRGPAR
jgi:hypothetical protein